MGHNGSGNHWNKVCQYIIIDDWNLEENHLKFYNTYIYLQRVLNKVRFAINSWWHYMGSSQLHSELHNIMLVATKSACDIIEICGVNMDAW